MTRRRSVAQPPGQSDLHVVAVISVNLPSRLGKIREPLVSLVTWTCQLGVEAGPARSLISGGRRSERLCLVWQSPAPGAPSAPTQDPRPGGTELSLFSGALGRLAPGFCPRSATFFGVKEHILDSLLAKCDKPKDLGLLALGAKSPPTTESHVSPVRTHICARQTHTDGHGEEGMCHTHTHPGYFFSLA